MALSPLERFLIADYETQNALLDDATVARAVKAWAGDQVFDELMRYRPDVRHLAAGPKNLIFVPGIMGSVLHSRGLGGVWWLDMLRARDKLNLLALTADGQSDHDVDAEIVPAAIDISYVPFRRAVIASQHFGGSEEFPYDWRKPLRRSAHALKERILACAADYGQPVHLVAHSMGGLMIRTTLMLHGDALWPKIGRIAFIATPHYGSPSIAGYLKNHLWGWDQLAIVGMFLSRETFRSMRGALSLLPAPTGIYPGTRQGQDHPCANFDLYDAAAWKLDLSPAATEQLQATLDDAAAAHTDLHRWHEQLPQQHRDKVLMIVGVGHDTLFRLEFDTAFWGAWDRTRKVKDRKPGNPHRDGDQRVPQASAELEYVTVRYARGRHGALPNIPAVYRDALAWVTGGNLALPATAAAALGGHLAAGEAESIAPHLDGSAEGERFQDLPKYERPTEAFKREIEARLEAGEFPLINRVNIL